jgi:hypothetical protein
MNRVHRFLNETSRKDRYKTVCKQYSSRVHKDCYGNSSVKLSGIYFNVCTSLNDIRLRKKSDYRKDTVFLSIRCRFPSVYVDVDSCFI